MKLISKGTWYKETWLIFSGIILIWQKQMSSGWMNSKLTRNNVAALSKTSHSDKPLQPWGFKPETAHLGRNWLRCECLLAEQAAQSSLMEAVKFYFALKPVSCAWVSVKTLSKWHVVHLAVQHSGFIYHCLQMDLSNTWPWRNKEPSIHLLGNLLIAPKIVSSSGPQLRLVFYWLWQNEWSSRGNVKPFSQ